MAEKATLKEWAITHGVKRGGIGDNGEIPTGEIPELDLCAEDEGLLTFVQSVTCRRKIWAQIFESSTEPVSAVPCCDICVPTLLEKTRPSSITKAPPISSLKTRTKGVVDESMKKLLEEWRDSILYRDHAQSPLDSTAILSDKDVDHLSSIGQITKDVLKSILGTSWPWWDRYSAELIARTENVEVAFVPLPKPSRKLKRSPAEQADKQDRSAKKTRSASIPVQDTDLHIAECHDGLHAVTEPTSPPPPGTSQAVYASIANSQPTASRTPQQIHATHTSLSSPYPYYPASYSHTSASSSYTDGTTAISANAPANQQPWLQWPHHQTQSYGLTHGYSVWPQTTYYPMTYFQPRSFPTAGSFVSSTGQAGHSDATHTHFQP